MPAATPEQAITLQHETAAAGLLLLWTITTNTADYGAAFVARPHIIVPKGRGPFPLDFVLVCDTLNGLRAALPPGLINLGREPGDLPVVVETWL